MLWDHMLRGAADAPSPSTLGLQVSLVLLSHLRPQLLTIFAEERSLELAQFRAFTLLQSVRVPDASAGWLLQRAQQVRLHVAAIKDMRMRVRMALAERRAREPTATLPAAEPLPDLLHLLTDVSGGKQLPTAEAEQKDRR